MFPWPLNIPCLVGNNKVERGPERPPKEWGLGPGPLLPRSEGSTVHLYFSRRILTSKCKPSVKTHSVLNKSLLSVTPGLEAGGCSHQTGLQAHQPILSYWDESMTPGLGQSSQQVNSRSISSAWCVGGATVPQFLYCKMGLPARTILEMPVSNFAKSLSFLGLSVSICTMGHRGRSASFLSPGPH